MVLSKKIEVTTDYFAENSEDFIGIVTGHLDCMSTYENTHNLFGCGLESQDTMSLQINPVIYENPALQSNPGSNAYPGDAYYYREN